jgi:hypothetical protein
MALEIEDGFGYAEMPTARRGVFFSDYNETVFGMQHT